MTVPVWIGPDRRLTLVELHKLLVGEATLQFQQETTATTEPPQADVPDDPTTAEAAGPYTVAFWIVLAFQLVQVEGTCSSNVQALVQAVNNNQTAQGRRSRNKQESASANNEDQTTILNSLQDLNVSTTTSSSKIQIDIQRVLELSFLAYSTYLATQLNVANLPISAMSVDSMGMTNIVLPRITELDYDKLRPHRSMVTTAATLRTLLHDSRFQKKQVDGDAAVAASALTEIPQYHGPAEETLTNACKTLELEINSRQTAARVGSDLIDLCTEQVSAAVRMQITKCLERRGLTGDEMPNTTPLRQLVQNWETCLTEEVQTAMRIIQEATAEAEREAREKEQAKAEKQQRAQQQQTNNNDKKNEFEGMTEAQIAKILKKRAEKEAKAAAKRQAKEAKGTSLFATGTQAIFKVLLEEPTILRAVPDLQAAMDKISSGGVQRKPKIPKGTRDYLPDQMMIRQQAFAIIRRVFQSHGAVEIDTPVFELKDTLTGKYGEDSKLIYDLADQGGELLALRYDLTVPFARFLALNSVGNIKRFHIGKVYRRDQPALKRGRYREFYQCDFDIAGTYARMVPDSESVAVVCDILEALPIGDFLIKLNHRRLLDAILDICGVPADKFRTICSAVDKLDKEEWSEVKREMVEDKGLLEEVADRIGEFVLKKGPPLELYKELIDTQRFGAHKGASEAMEDLRILFDYLEALGKLKFVSFDLSLARGLDYYTGVIYEAVCMKKDTQVGSIGGGGRYDNLVSMFQEAGKQTPCVGVSVGIERVFTLMEENLRQEKGGSIKQPNVNVLVASAGNRMMKEKMRITRMLWDANISAEFTQQETVKIKKEVVNALDRGIPFMVVIGESELAENKCQVKDIKANTAELVPINDLILTLRKKGVIPVGCEFAAELLKQES